MAIDRQGLALLDLIPYSPEQMRLRLPGWFVLRSLVKELRLLREGQTEQNRLLRRLADRFAPAAPAADPAVVSRETGVTYTDPLDQALLEEYAVRIHQATGHFPTDDELLAYISDDRTRTLHQRLAERDRLAREDRS